MIYFVRSSTTPARKMYRRDVALIFVLSYTIGVFAKLIDTHIMYRVLSHVMSRPHPSVYILARRNSYHLLVTHGAVCGW